MYLRPRDMARIGELMLRDGTIAGKKILSPDWIKQSTSAWSEGKGGYGYWWRVQRFFPSAGPAVETVNALGHGGQHIIFAKNEDLVVVMTSNWSVPGNISTAYIRKNHELFRNGIIPSLTKRY